MKSGWGEDDTADTPDQHEETKAEGESKTPEGVEDAEKSPDAAVGELGEGKEEEKETITLKEYEEQLKAKSLTNVVQRPEVDMGQFEGLTVYAKVEEGTGLEAAETTKPKKTKGKGKKDGKREVIPTSFRVGDPVRRGRGRGTGRGAPGGRLDREGWTHSGEEFTPKQDWGGGDGVGDSQPIGYRGSSSYRTDRGYEGEGGYVGYGGYRNSYGGRGRSGGGRRGGYRGSEGFEFENKQTPLDMADTKTFPALTA